MAEPRAVLVRVSGRVQGVGFRAFVVDEAQHRGLTGWVRNDADGSVETRVEGPDAAVAELLRSLEHGPPSARVDGVRVEDVEPEGARRFSVR